MIFQKINENNIDIVTEYLEKAKTPFCDNTPATVFMWADYYDFEYALFEGIMFVKSLSLSTNEQTAFFLPIGDFKEGIRLLKEYNGNKPLQFSPVSEKELELFADYEHTVQKIDNWSDYVYRTEHFATLVGHKYNSKRNHVKRFQNAYDFRYEEISTENLEQVKSFLQSFPAVSAQSDYELSATIRLLDNRGRFALKSGVLFVEDKVVAVTLGEGKGDTLVVHTERADKCYEGSFEYMAHRFAKEHSGFVYLNREEDMGIEGLKTAKLSWHPEMLLDKYAVLLK